MKSTQPQMEKPMAVVGFAVLFTLVFASFLPFDAVWMTAILSLVLFFVLLLIKKTRKTQLL